MTHRNKSRKLAQCSSRRSDGPTRRDDVPHDRTRSGVGTSGDGTDREGRPVGLCHWRDRGVGTCASDRLSPQSSLTLRSDSPTRPHSEVTMHRILTPTFDRRRFQLWLKSLSSPGAKRDNDAVLGGHDVPLGAVISRRSVPPRHLERLWCGQSARNRPPGLGLSEAMSRAPRSARLTWRSGPHLPGRRRSQRAELGGVFSTLAYVKGGDPPVIAPSSTDASR